jgi:CRISPR-associated endoribonuclease Cas6
MIERQRGGVMARVRVDVRAAEPALQWRDVHGPARAFVYGLIAMSEPEMARQLHDQGWQGSTLRPVGISPPLFTGAVPRHGVYTTSSSGSIWIGSPVPRIAAAILRGVSGLEELRWGGAHMTIRGKDLEWLPDHGRGQAEFVTVSPVLVKRGSRFLLPGDDGYAECLAHNLRHKADVLGLPSDIEIEVLGSGPRRIFEVAGAKRIGANVRLRLAADPALLDALYEWGLGLNTVQGFGWVK